MKLVRFEYQGAAHIGVLDGEEKIVPLKTAGGASMSAFLATGATGLEAAKQAIADTPAEPRLSLDAVKLLAPVGDPGKIMCIGQNYRDHCEEQNQPIPERAILFAKYSNTLNDPGGVIKLPACLGQDRLRGGTGCRDRRPAEAAARCPRRTPCSTWRAICAPTM